MDRIRDGKRPTGGLLAQRRRRTISLRDSPDEDRLVDMQERGKFRDRRNGGRYRDHGERGIDRERDRHSDLLGSARSKKRSVDRIMQGCRRHDYGNESTEGSVDDEENEDRERTRTDPRSLQSYSSLPSSRTNHIRRRSFTPDTCTKSESPWKCTDEMITAVSIPRKARSASTKRSHSAKGGTSFSTGCFGADPINVQQAPISPAGLPISPAPTSPSSSNTSLLKKASHQPEKTTSKSCSSTQEDIEFEIAEVLFELRRKHGPSRLDTNIVNPDTAKSRISSPISSSPAPQESQAVINQEPEETDRLLPPDVMISSLLNIDSAIAGVREPYDFPDASPAATPELEDEDTGLDGESSTVDEPKHPVEEQTPLNSIHLEDDDDNGVPANKQKQRLEIDLMAPPEDHSEIDSVLQNPASLDEELAKKMNAGIEMQTSGKKSEASTPPRHRRCATHCYIARCIFSHQRMTTTATMNGQPCTMSELHLQPPVPRHSQEQKQQVQQQNLLQKTCSPANNNMLPESFSPSPAASCSVPPWTGYSYPNEIQYLAVMENAGCPFPPDASPAIPFFGVPFYSSQISSAAAAGKTRSPPPRGDGHEAYQHNFMLPTFPFMPTASGDKPPPPPPPPPLFACRHNKPPATIGGAYIEHLIPPPPSSSCLPQFLESPSHRKPGVKRSSSSSSSSSLKQQQIQSQISFGAHRSCEAAQPSPVIVGSPSIPKIAAPVQNGGMFIIGNAPAFTAKLEMPPPPPPMLPSSKQAVQAQVFFANSYVVPHSGYASTPVIASGAGGYYLQRRLAEQQQPAGGMMSMYAHGDGGKLLAAARTASSSPQSTPPTLLPACFPFAHPAFQLKAAERK